MAKTIVLTQGLSTIVDDEDYAELSKYKWHRPLMASACEDCGRLIEDVMAAGQKVYEVMAPVPGRYPQVVHCSVCVVKPANRNIFINPTQLARWRAAHPVKEA